ncbi:hypothetical protein JCM10449v2_007605 [Rhodotorula kratochvilovae]
MPDITVTAPPEDLIPPASADDDDPRRSSLADSAASTTAQSNAPLHLAVPDSTHATGPGAGRGRNRSASTATERETTILNPDHPPRLDTFKFGLKGPFFYVVFLIIMNVLIPCLLYYLLRIYTHLTDKELIGIGSAALGASSCFDAPFRVWKLTRHRAKYGPLYYPFAPDPAYEPAGKRWIMKDMPRSWWHFDFTMWAYQFGLFSMAVPLAIAPAIPLYNFYLFSLAMLAIPVMIIFALTLKVWHALPFWMSSDPPRTPTKPAVYYFLEDVGAVDFKHGREWRKRCQARYAASPPFRALMWNQTLLWTVGMAIFIGVTAAVDWTADLQFAFGFVLGLFFIWAIVWGLLSYLHVHLSLQRELRWWRAKYACTVVAGLVPHDEAHVRPGTPQPEGHAGVEKSGAYDGGRTRGYSVHARLEVPAPQEMAQVQRGEAVSVPAPAALTGDSGLDRAGAAGQVV